MTRTIENLNSELKEIRRGREHGKYTYGMFGILACKESIQWKLNYEAKCIQEIYADLCHRALTETGFNIIMIVACEEMMEMMEDK